VIPMAPHQRIWPLLLLLTALTSTAQPQADLSIPVRTTRVSGRVAVFECLDVNVTAIATDKGIVVIDTNYSPGLMEAIAGQIEREFGRRDVRFVVNTHAHLDHCGGNQVFPGAVVVGHENCAEFMKHQRADSPANLGFHERRLARARTRLGQLNRPGSPEERELAAEIRARELLLADLRGQLVLTPPTLTFRDRLWLDTGAPAIELIYCGQAHSNNDICAYIPAERVLVTGDLFGSADRLGFSVNAISDVPRLVAVIDSVRRCDGGIATVVPGHGAPFEGRALEHLRDLLVERRQALASQRSAAAVLDTLIRTSGTDAALRWFAELDPAARGELFFAEEEFNTLGQRLRWTGRNAEGIAVLELATTIFPESALLYGSLGGAYLEDGDVPSARASFEKSLELLPENRSAADMLEALRGRD
jgi:glyoxylase-like metal-dependent hydrolase (beta-lactamase superfamily II)